MLKLQNINAGYGPKQILRNISLAIEPGEVVALLGSNGAGKSTVLKVVSGLLQPMSGTVSLCDENVTSLPTHRRARLGIGYVMQNGPLFGSLTAAEHNRLTAQSRGRKPPERTNDMDSRKTGGVLSGGERQRLAVELCLQQNPKLLLLDEPSAGVSPGRAAEIYAMLKERIKKTQTAVLVVEQNLHFLPGFADRFVVLRSGEIFEEDLPPEILEDNEKMFKIFSGA